MDSPDEEIIAEFTLHPCSSFNNMVIELVQSRG